MQATLTTCSIRPSVPRTRAARPQCLQTCSAQMGLQTARRQARLVSMQPSQVLRARGRKNMQVYGLFGLGLPELAVIAGVAALVWGPSKLPEIGKSLGKAAKGLQDGVKEFNEELKKATTDEEEKAKLPGTTPEAKQSETTKKE